MNKFPKIIAALILGVSLIGSAQAASNATYGASKAIAKIKANANDSQVTLYNDTDNNYTSHAVFEPSGSSLDMALGPLGSGTDIITYTIVDPDDEVCLRVTRDYDGYVAFNDCVSSGSVSLEPSKTAGDKKPLIKVTKI
jgi:hypothetical protein